MKTGKLLDHLNRELYISSEVAKALTIHLELPDLLETVMDKIDEDLDPAAFGVILLWNPSEGFLFREHLMGQG